MSNPLKNSGVIDPEMVDWRLEGLMKCVNTMANSEFLPEFLAPGTNHPSGIKSGQEFNEDCQECLDLKEEFGSQMTVEVEPKQLNYEVMGQGRHWDTNKRELSRDLTRKIKRCPCLKRFDRGLKECQALASKTLIFHADMYEQGEADLTQDIIHHLRQPVEDLKKCLEGKIGEIKDKCRNKCLPKETLTTENLISIFISPTIV